MTNKADHTTALIAAHRDMKQVLWKLSSAIQHCRFDEARTLNQELASLIELADVPSRKPDPKS